MSKRTIILLTAAAVLLLIGGCSKPYKITQELREPVDPGGICNIGEIEDALPPDFEADKKPTVEHIEMFKEYLIKELNERNLFYDARVLDPDAAYEVRGAIIDFKQGSGFIRFLGLFGAGNAHVTISLELVDSKTDEIVFGGNFKRVITSYFESGDKSFEYIAEDFAKALEKQMDDLMQDR